MNPAQRAEFLIKKYGKEMAINVVEDILHAFSSIYDDWISNSIEYECMHSNGMKEYFQDVQKEIQER